MSAEKITEYKPQLPTIGRILELLGLNDEKINQVALASKSGKYPNMAFGNIAVALGLVTQEDLDTKLTLQAKNSANAALLDIQFLTDNKDFKFDQAYFQKIHLGNNDQVNIVQNPTITDAITSAAEFAKLMVIAANHVGNRQFALHAIRDAKNLCIGLIEGDSQEIPLSKKWKEWLDNIETTFCKLAIEFGRDSKLVKEFSDQRSKEIQNGVNLQIEKEKIFGLKK